MIGNLHMHMGNSTGGYGHNNNKQGLPHANLSMFILSTKCLRNVNNYCEFFYDYKFHLIGYPVMKDRSG